MNVRRLIRERIIEPIRQARGSPAFIARGVALGTWIGLTPTVGIQMLLVAALAIPLRANIPAAIALVWISNPFTLVPIYYTFHWVGAALLGHEAGAFEDMAGRFQEPAHHVLGLGSDLVWPTVLGSLVIATVCAVPAYYMTLRLVCRHRARLAGKHRARPVVQDRAPS